MNELTAYITDFPLWGTLFTVFGFYMGQQLYLKSGRHAALQPVVFGMAFIISAILLLEIPYDAYFESSSLLSAMLGPATVGLAIPLYQNARRIRQLIFPILCTVVVAGSLTVALAVGILWALGGSELSLLSMTTKSITTPIAMIVSEQIGGIAALSALCVLITGALGAMIGIPLMNRLGIQEPSVKGFTMGLTAHALGTARALEENDECAAFSALAMSITGVLTALIVPFLF